MDGYIILVAFFVLLIAVGVVTSRKVRTTGDFMLGGRRLGPWLSAFSYGTTYFSAVVFVGYAGRFGWSYGLSATWVGIGNAIIGSLVAWLLLAERTRRMSRAMDVATMAEFFKMRYDSAGLEKLSALIIFVFLIPYSAAVYQGLGLILQAFFQGTFLADIRWSMGLMAIVTAIYLWFGGTISTAVNSVIQGTIMFFGVIGMLILTVTGTGGWQKGVESLSRIADTGLAAGSLASPFGPKPFDLLMIVLMTSFGTFGLPQMISKYKSIRDTKATHRATVMSFIFALVIGGGAYLMGGFSRQLVVLRNIPFDGTNLDRLMPMVFQSILSPTMMSILVVLMLSASMSTLAGVVLVSAPTFTRTVLRSDRISVMRLMSLLFVLASFLVFLIPSTTIVTLMSFSWGAVSGSFVGPYIWGLYWKKVTRQAAWTGMIAGLATVVIGAAIVFATGAAAGVWAPRLAVLAMTISSVVTPFVSLAGGRSARLPEGARFV